MQVPGKSGKGEFHITIIRKIGILGIIKNFKGLYNGRFTQDHKVSTHTGRVVEIIPKSSIAGEADGESLGLGSYKIKILPHKLTLFAALMRVLINFLCNLFSRHTMLQSLHKIHSVSVTGRFLFIKPITSTPIGQCLLQDLHSVHSFCKLGLIFNNPICLQVS